MDPLPRDHSDYTELDSCPCVLCTDYRNAFIDFMLATKELEKGNHPVRCKCELCKTYQKISKIHTIADAKRMLWSEAVFTAENHSWGSIFLDWVENRILCDDDPDSFWTQDIEATSMDQILEEWIESLTTEGIARISAAKLHKDDEAVQQALLG